LLRKSNNIPFSQDIRNKNTMTDVFRTKDIKALSLIDVKSSLSRAHLNTFARNPIQNLLKLTGIV